MPTRPERVLVDTSVAVASMTAAHHDHAACRAAIKGTRAGLSGHAWFETFSVVTRLPPPQRQSPAAVSAALQANFPETRWLSEQASADVAARCAQLGISGGAIYDALVGACAVEHGLPLYSRDQRALPVYSALGVDVRLVT